MLIYKAEIERVKRANELVGFIRSRGVTLTKRGKQFVGLCPVHPDTEQASSSIPRNNCGTVWVRVVKAATCIAL